MEGPPNLPPSFPRLSALDPCRDVREADLALLFGRREDANALIERAYLAFDLLTPECDEFMGRGKA